MAQQGDVLLFQTTNGGDIIAENGTVAMSGGLETAAYLSMFGGNEDDDGLADNSFNWWGNIDQFDSARQYHSKTQNLLQSIPATSGNLRRIEDAAKRDLRWFIESNVANKVEVTARITAPNEINLSVVIEAQGEESMFEYVENWKAVR